MKNEFIEVTGEGEYQERIEKYILELRIEVRASDEEKALKDVFSLKDKTVIELKRAGLATDNIIDGGHELWKPWYGRKKTGKCAYYKLILETGDENLLSKSIERATLLFQEQRFNMTYEMKQPKYENPIEAEKQAINDAFENAMKKASAIAVSSSIEIGNLLQVTELSKSKRNSGSYGDEDWFGDESRFGSALVAGAAEEDNPAMKKTERTVWIRYKFRFEINQVT
ncbi:hypothetical protein FUAX_41290 (plasmid) [Fulvitalea axinellae]|uniref:DUF541 domain-containing protein n=1 Tax=Fulvitalea axinellae TaxID=1182444 RepID=A0AAU9CUM2_9BACT|nr:hypothetical protein FUAX_41290 [Fulvitalea axinellae]